MNDMRKLMESLQAVTEDSTTYLDQVDIIDYDGGYSRDELSKSTYTGSDSLHRAVVNSESGKLLFVGSQAEAEQFIRDLRDNLTIIDQRSGFCEVWPRHRKDQTMAWYRGSREDCERFIQGAPVNEEWGEGLGDEEEMFFVIRDGGEPTLISLMMGERAWEEVLHAGERPYGFGSKTYMSYLGPDELRGYLSRDYDEVLGPFDYDDALEHFQELLTESPVRDDDLGLEPEPDLEPDLGSGTEHEGEDQEDDPLHVHHQSRIKASIVRVYRELGDENPNPVLTLNALRRLAQGKMPMGPQAQNLSTLASGILDLMEDPASVSLLIRALQK